MLINSIKQLNMFKKFLLVVLMATIGAVFVYACGSESDEQLSGNLLQISISCPDPITAAQQSKLFGLERSLADIVLLRLTVEGGIPPIVKRTEEFDPQDSDISIDVFVGTNRIFTIFGLGIEGIIVCMGTTITDITIDTEEIDIGCDLVNEICTGNCNDPVCDGSRCDSGNGICIDGTCQDPDVPPEPGDDDDDDVPDREDDFAGECSDGIDNDEDGFTDCNDLDCIRSIDCRPVPPPPPSPVCEVNEQGFPISCTDACCNNPNLCNSCECCEFDLPEKNPAFCSNPE
ncbi:MAG: hypothetical protein V3U58_02500 [Thermodesulfobacteriota bacterium]